MTDVFSKAERSQIMSKIRSKGTFLEITVFKFLKKNKIKFKRHDRKLPGKPDVVMPERMKVIFINGDFWHGYRFVHWQKRLPKKYWRNKIKNNIKRDRNNYAKLRKLGWQLLRIWGHDINKTPIKAFNKIKKFLGQ